MVNFLALISTRCALADNTHVVVHRQAETDGKNVIAHYECEQKKIVAVDPNTKDYEPHYDRLDCSSDDCNPPNFTVDVIDAKPNERCTTDYYDKLPLSKWIQCLAKYTIAFDGYKFRPRSYSLSRMRSDDGVSFVGSNGAFFHVADRGDYVAEYSGEGPYFLETGICKKQ